jgi:hypothetical protein
VVTGRRVGLHLRCEVAGQLVIKFLVWYEVEGAVALEARFRVKQI